MKNDIKNLYRNSAWLYDIERNNEHFTADIPFYMEYARQQKGDVLELGCGTGRVALALAGEGFNVTGLDLSQQMLDVFQEKLTDKPALTGKFEKINKIKIVHGNMADFSLGRKYALIIAPFRAFQALTNDSDIANALTCIRRHLADDGIFIINVFNPWKGMDESWCSPDEDVDFEVEDKETGLNVVRKSRRERIDLENHVIYPYLAHEVTYPDGRVERIVDCLQMKYYYSQQLRDVVETAGLKITEEYSWYDKAPPGGREIIFVCRK